MIVGLLFFSCIILRTEAQEPKLVPRQLLIQDARQLAQILDLTHPDPYIRGGGKIAFYRRLQEILRAIPQEGMPVKDFYKQLLPFVAAVGDGHTALSLGQRQQASRPGLPLGFDIVEQSLYVARVIDKNDEFLLGALLFSVEGVYFQELVERQGRLSGWDNEYQRLTHLSRNLATRDGLAMLLPEWKGGDSIRIVFKTALGEEKECVLFLPENIRAASIIPLSKINLPSVEKVDFVYDFLDPDKKIALLRIDGMFGYRENFEYFNVMGVDWVKLAALQIYKKFHGKGAPNEFKDVLAGIPSATEAFRSLAIDMKKAKTKTLLVDLRKNGGGNSLMTQILVYFLYGRRSMEEISMSSSSVKKYSGLYFSQYKEDTLEKINRDRSFQLNKDDYDFQEELDFLSPAPADKEKLKEKMDEYLSLMPSFAAEYKSGKYEAYYRPENVFILGSAWTYSSGFTLERSLVQLGGVLIGTPSGQAGNCFGDTLGFVLTNTGIQGSVSYKQFVNFPNDPEKGRVLRPEVELTYQKLASCGFDPNAEVILALDKLGMREQNPYGAAREEDRVTVDYEMAERALEWLEYINTGADKQSIRQFFLERVASTKGCQAIIHHWARFRKWDEEEFFRFIMEALGRIPVELAEKGDRRAAASLERRMKFWESALANPARIKKDLEDLKKTDLKKAAVALARRYLPDDAVVSNDFCFVLFGASTAFSVGKENGFDLLQLPKTKDGRLDVDQIVLNLAHEIHHSGFSECLERNTPRIQEDERIMLLGILAAEGMPTYFINKPFESLEEMKSSRIEFYNSLAQEWENNLSRLAELYREAEKDIRLNFEGVIGQKDIFEKWMGGLQGPAYALGSAMFSTIEKNLGLDSARLVPRNILEFLVIYNKAADKENQKGSRCFIFDRELVDRIARYRTQRAD